MITSYAGAYSYTRDTLLSIRPTVTSLPRRLRKSLFGFGLWLPAHCRSSNINLDASKFPSPGQVPTTGQIPSDNVGRHGQHAEKLLSAGYLNAQSIGNKSAFLQDVIAENRLDLLSIV